METDRQNHNFLSSLLLESEMLRFILFRKFYSGQLLIKILVAVLTNDKLLKLRLSFILQVAASKEDVFFQRSEA